MNIFEAETIRQVVEHGPVRLGNIANHKAYLALVERQWVTITMVQGDYGYVAVTTAGLYVYMSEFPHTLTTTKLKKIMGIENDAATTTSRE